jgi:formylglycine-generating enzyme required for sulfatase activity
MDANVSAAPGKREWKMDKVLSVIAVSILAGFTFHTSSAEAFTNSLGMKMIMIEPGTFEMGSPKAKADSWDEQPVHEVTISQPFYISETEVAIEQFQEFRRNYTGSLTDEPYVTGLSWHDAVAFCEWLSKKEGKPYRLPTEAEWEYAARAGTNTPFWSGDEPPEPGSPNPWGLKNVHSPPAEWCRDWYGPYLYKPQVDPIGPEDRTSRVIRGGGADSLDHYYARCHNRVSYAPAFGMMKGTEPVKKVEKKVFSTEPNLEGLIGVWYGKITFEKPKAVDPLVSLDMDWDSFQQPGQDRASRWSARWQGVLVAPASGRITFYMASDYGASLAVDDKAVVEWEAEETERSGSIVLEKGKKYPIGISYIHSRGERKFLKVEWSWQGHERTGIPRDSLWHSEAQHEAQKAKAPKEIEPGHHNIGFRIVQGPMPARKPYRSGLPFFRECVVQDQPRLMRGPDPKEPWFRKRDLLPIPPDDMSQQESIAVGLFPGSMPHVTNPGLVVCPNGDVIAVLFTAAAGPHGEDRPDVSLIATRLRFGASRWDMPECFIDFGDINDTSSLLWREGRTIYCFWGHTYHKSAYPFQWMTSTDNAVTWSQVRFPQFAGQIGPRTNQPINSAIRAADGTFYLPCDGIGGTSVLWVTEDNMKTWYDPGGRTFGRHATCALLKDGRILGMGGKHTNIDGYMPKSISSDGGKTWEISKTPFCELGTQQRPTLLRLKSGRLFFTGDFQHRTGRYPAGIKQRGAYVALSDDEGQTWHIKKLLGTLPYDGLFPYINQGNPHNTVGYTVAQQAPNGIIHMVSSFNHPAQHWELNEAWILNDSAGYLEHKNPQITKLKQFEQTYSSGQIRATWSGGITEEGEYRLHGRQVWYYKNGNKQWEVTYEAGDKAGDETYWGPEGNKVWTWKHNEDDTEVWTQYYPNGRKKSESTWRYSRAEEAKRWNIQGELISESRFADGRLVTTYMP